MTTMNVNALNSLQPLMTEKITSAKTVRNADILTLKQKLKEIKNTHTESMKMKVWDPTPRNTHNYVTNELLSLAKDITGAKESIAQSEYKHNKNKIKNLVSMHENIKKVAKQSNNRYLESCMGPYRSHYFYEKSFDVASHNVTKVMQSLNDVIGNK